MRYDVILSNEVQNTPLLTAKNSRTLTSPGRAPRARAASIDRNVQWGTSHLKNLLKTFNIFWNRSLF